METVPDTQLSVPYCRMDPFEEKLRRLKEAFNTGKTKSAKFRAEQLLNLGHFLKDNSKELHDALAGDLGKVLWGCGVGHTKVLICLSEAGLHPF